jgi:threonine synthase
MTTVLDANVHNIAVEGSFDDCQRIMKSLAGDLAFKRKYSLGAVNSVNWARVLAQIVYFFSAAFDVQRVTGREAVRFSVPTGNFGDVLAGYYALRMGLPISQLILATNENDILARFFDTGEYTMAPTVHQTLSPSMDIQVASNFERYLYCLVGSDPQRLRGLMDDFARTGSLKVAPRLGGVVDPVFYSDSADTDLVLETIHRFVEGYDYVLDPHTAVGVAVAQRCNLSRDPVICLATAHPAKFPAAIQRATGQDLAHHPSIDALMDLPTRCVQLPNDQEAVREFIIRTIG